MTLPALLTASEVCEMDSSVEPSRDASASVAGLAGGWQPIEGAPRDGRQFLALQDGNVYQARYGRHGGATPRIEWRTHGRFEQSQHRVVEVEVDGERVRALVPINQPWREDYRHDWTLWTRGFDFKPTHWAPMPGDAA